MWCKTAEGAAFCYLGNAYQRNGDFKETMERYNQDLAIVHTKAMGDKASEGRAFGILGLLMTVSVTLNKALSAKCNN